MTVQAGLCWTCSETTLLVFPQDGSNVNILMYTNKNTKDKYYKVLVFFFHWEKNFLILLVLGFLFYMLSEFGF